MREDRRHRPDGAARLALVAGCVGIAWTGAELLLCSGADAHADDGLLPPIVSTTTDAVTGLLPPPSPLPSPGDLLPGVDLPPLPDIDLPVVPALPDLPIVPTLPGVTDVLPLPVLPVVPQLPSTPIGVVLPPASGVAGDGSSAAIPTLPTAPSPGSAPSSPPTDVPWLAGSALEPTPVTPPASPAPPTPSSATVGSASVLAPPPADRTASPHAHFASFPLPSPPGRGPPTGPSCDVDTSPD